MDKICSLCIIWEEKDKLQKKPLLADKLYNIDKYILEKKYNSSSDIRNDKNFKAIIDEFLKDKKLESRNYRGNIVIMDGTDKIRVMYKPRIDLIKKLIKLITLKMQQSFNDKSSTKLKGIEYTRNFIKEYQSLFNDSERIGLYSGLKYNNKTLFNKTLDMWKRRFTNGKDNQYIYDNMRKIYKKFDDDINERIDKLVTEEKNVEEKNYFVQKNEENFIENIELMDEFEAENKFHLDEGLRMIHTTNNGEIVYSEKYSDYLKRTEDKVDIDDDKKRFK